MLKRLIVVGMLLAIILLFVAPKVLATLVLVPLVVVVFVCIVLLGFFPLVLELIEKFVPKKEEKSQHDH